MISIQFKENIQNTHSQSIDVGLIYCDVLNERMRLSIIPEEDLFIWYKNKRYYYFIPEELLFQENARIFYENLSCILKHMKKRLKQHKIDIEFQLFKEKKWISSIQKALFSEWIFAYKEIYHIEMKYKDIKNFVNEFIEFIEEIL